MLVIFRFGSFIPVPFLSADAISAFMSNMGEDSLLNLMNMFSGGAFSQATIFAMSISPYINASIIMQLLTVAIPALEANNIDAMLVHEAAIGKIAGEQLTKLMSLGLTEQEAEEQIIGGFLK